MRQAVHIFLKDSRQLRVPIAISLAWTALFAATEGSAVGGTFVVAGTIEWLGPTLRFDGVHRMLYLVQNLSLYVMPAAWLLLIALAFHAEALPGDRQFWLTRPYSRGSLIGAKALFVLTYITVPTTLAQALLVVRNGLPLWPVMPGLFLEQVLLTGVVVIPAAALAALTSTLTHFIFSLLIAPIIGVAYSSKIEWRSFEWIRSSTLVCLLALAACVVLFLQFSRRSTVRARTIGLAGVLAIVVATVALPWRTVFALQSHLAPAPSTTVTATLARPTPAPVEPAAAALQPMVRSQGDTAGIVPLDDRGVRGVQLHFEMAGPPSDTPIRCEADDITVENPGGRTWRSGLRLWNYWSSISTIAAGCVAELPPSFANALAGGLVNVHAVFYATVFGPAEATSIPIGGARTTLPDSMVCAGKRDVRNIPPVIGGPQDLTRVECRSAFLSLSPLMWSISPPGEPEVFRGIDTPYSPLPAELTLFPVYRGQKEFMKVLDTVVAAPRKPLAHVRVEVNAQGVRLEDYNWTR